MTTENESSLSSKPKTAPRPARTKKDALGWLFCAAGIAVLGYLISLARRPSETDAVMFLYPALLFTVLAGYGTRLAGLTRWIGFYWCLCGVLWLILALLAAGRWAYEPVISLSSYWYRLVAFGAPFILCSVAGSIILHLKGEARAVGLYLCLCGGIWLASAMFILSGWAYELVPSIPTSLCRFTVFGAAFILFWAAGSVILCLKGDSDWRWWIVCGIPCGIVTLFCLSLANRISESTSFPAIFIPILLLWYVACRLVPVSNRYPKQHKGLLVILEIFLATVLAGGCVFWAHSYATMIAPQEKLIASLPASNSDPAAARAFEQLRHTGGSFLFNSLSHGISFVMFVYLAILLRLRTNSGKRLDCNAQPGNQATGSVSSES